MNARGGFHFCACRRNPRRSKWKDWEINNFIERYGSVLKKLKWLLWLLTGLVILGAGIGWHLRQYPPYLRPVDRIIIARWMLNHPGYRLARPADCGKCSSQINDLRNGSGDPEFLIPDFTPYYARGDFNRDGKMDFAVAVMDDNARESPFTILVFNGPLAAMRSVPAFASEELPLWGGGLFYFPQRKTPDNALIAGPFNSDDTVLFVPHGDTYEPDYGDAEGE